MDMPKQSKVPDIPVSCLRHAPDSWRNKCSCYWRGERRAGAVQQLCVHILDYTGQEAADDAPHSCRLLAQYVVMLEICQDHL